MILTPLYSRDSNEGIRVWKIEVDGDRYRTISGVINGAEVVSEWTICAGKNIGRANETSPEAQALREAKAKHKKKIETGYFENIKDIDKITTFFPMLAHKYVDHGHKLPSRVAVSPKMDGVRIIIKEDGVFSRGGKNFPALQFIRDELDVIFKRDPKIIFDGEAYCHALAKDFDKLISLVKKTKRISDKDHAEIQRHIQGWIFDMPRGGMYFPSEPFSTRYEFLKEIFNSHKFKYLRLLRYQFISKNQIPQYEELFIKESFEGIMIRDPEAPYENDRSYSLQKLKRFIDEEFEIIDVIEGDGNRSGMMGSVALRNKDGAYFNASCKGNEEFFTRLLNEKVKVIGKMATVRYQNLTPDEGVPRFGVIHSIRDYE